LDFGIAVLAFVILIDIVLMVGIMRAILKEPPRKHPAAHPLALRYASGSVEAPPAKPAPEKVAAAPIETRSEPAGAEDAEKTELGD
jgi:hypothetical protein